MDELNGSLEERGIHARQSMNEVTERVTPPPFEPSPSRPPAIALVVMCVVIAGLGGWLIFGSGQETTVQASGPEQAESEDSADGNSSPSTIGDPVADDPVADDPVAGDTDADTSRPGVMPSARAQCPNPDPDGLPLQEPAPTEDSRDSQDSQDSAPGQDDFAGDYFIFDPSPPGYEALIYPVPGGDDRRDPRFSVYGCQGDAPFGEGDLLVATVGPGMTEADVAGGPDAEAIDIGGRQVWIDTSSAFPVVSWMEDEDTGTMVGLLSQSLNQEALVEIASTWFETGQVDPWGLQLLAEDVEPDFFFSSPRTTVFYIPSEATDGAQLGLQQAPTRAAVILNMWFDGAEQRQRLETMTAEGTAEVIDHNGISVEVDTLLDGEMTLTFERDGRRISLTAIGVGIGETPLEPLLALVDTVRPATDAEVDALRRSGG